MGDLVPVDTATGVLRAVAHLVSSTYILSLPLWDSEVMLPRYQYMVHGTGCTLYGSKHKFGADQTHGQITLSNVVVTYFW
jgi:hypothetical protein